MYYEKLHKDTITKLQEMVNSGKITVEIARGICADFVPESEDERIRKALIEMVHDTTGDELWVDYNVHKEDALDWLEKQGERKTPQWMIDFLDNYRRKIGCSLDHDEARDVDGKILCIKDWLEKQGEQKPKFRVGDTIRCKYDDRQFTIKSVDLDKGTYIYTQEGCGNDIDYADEEFELVEQKPAWSEEDEKFVHGLIRGLTVKRDIHGHTTFSSDCIDITETIDWLKSFKDRVQPKQEWSDVDKNILSRIIDNLMFIRDTISIDPNYAVNISDTEREITWLKSLRPQTTWKPSDEQMEALEHFVRSIGESGYASPYDNDTKLLYSLLFDLKKLREK